MGNQSLVVRNVARENSGDYVCVGSNEVGAGYSTPRVLDIKCRYIVGYITLYMYLSIALKIYV